MWIETYDKQFVNMNDFKSIGIKLYPYTNSLETDDYILMGRYDTDSNGKTKWLFRGTKEDCNYCYEALYLALKNNFNCITFNNERV